MNGLRALDVVLAVEVENSAGKIVIKDAKVVLKHSGKVLGNVNVAPLTLAARTTADYKVDVTLELDRGVNVMHLMSLMDVRKLNECTVDLSFKGKASGTIIKREFKDIPMKELLEELL